MTDVEDLYEAGVLAEDEARWSDAERLFRAVLAIDPDSAQALSGLANACTKLHRFAEARSAYERALEIVERQPVLTLLGAIQNKLGDRTAAISTLQRSLELMPEDDEAHYHLGLALRISDPARSLAHLEQACRIDPLPPNYHRELALTYWKLERFEDALEASQRALAGNPLDDIAHHGHALIRESLGDLQAAKDSHLRAAEITPSSGLFWASAARLAARQRRDREADMLFRRGLAADAESAVVCRYYGQFLQRRGRLPAAQRYLRRAAQLDPGSSAARWALEDLAGDR